MLHPAISPLCSHIYKLGTDLGRLWVMPTCTICLEPLHSICSWGGCPLGCHSIHFIQNHSHSTLFDLEYGTGVTILFFVLHSVTIFCPSCVHSFQTRHLISFWITGAGTFLPFLISHFVFGSTCCTAAIEQRQQHVCSSVLTRNRLAGHRAYGQHDLGAITGLKAVVTRTYHYRSRRSRICRFVSFS